MTTFLIVSAIIILIFLGIRHFFFKIGDPVNLKLSNSYFHHYRKNGIVYSPMGNWFELGYFESDADVESFQPINESFGKDKHNIFWKGKKQSVDYNTFEIDDLQIIKDKNHVYHLNGKNFDLLEIITDADPKTYQLLDPSIQDYRRNNWFKDAKFVYYKNKKIQGDPETFKPLNDTIAIDAHFIYAIISYRGEGTEACEVDEVIQKHKMIEGEIHPVNETYVQIGNSVVSAFTSSEFEIHTFDFIKTSKAIDYWKIIVDNVLISKGVVYPEVDAESFEVLDRDFSKDKNNIYYNCQTIVGADYSSFTILSDEYSKDAKNVYFQNAILKGANPEEFKSTNEYGVWEDGKNKFKNGQLYHS
ncbi:DKNYY domain-containing protein [Flavobacterium sp. FlaQc-47]|uniref:DKNYY domain-containing protein n=1 Tax=Flavobacterium sp. FlaQc-47 TaxID=3374180 RepID=UPI0037569F3B